MINEHERMLLTKSVPNEGLEAGDVGTVVHVYADGLAYEVEFTTLDGRTAAVVTVQASDVRPVGTIGTINGVFARLVDGIPPYAAPSSRRHSSSLRDRPRRPSRRRHF